MDCGRGVLYGGRDVRVARARNIGTPRGHAGGRRGGHAAEMVVRIPFGCGLRDGTRTAAPEQAGRDVRTVPVPPR